MIFFFFFFSSRRRHTRFSRDWSSDVCSSDLVTLAGRRHGERCAYSILGNLGVTQTVAHSGSEYVEIAVRLATDAPFRTEVSAAIRNALEHSALTDMDAHTRHLERAYLEALEQRYPAALRTGRWD